MPFRGQCLHFMHFVALLFLFWLQYELMGPITNERAVRHRQAEFSFGLRCHTVPCYYEWHGRRVTARRRGLLKGSERSDAAEVTLV